MQSIESIQQLIESGEVEQAISLLDNELLKSPSNEEKEQLFFLRGKAYWKKGDWKFALDNYQYAIELNPQSPAVEARAMAMDILSFFHKDMYNQ